MAIWHPWIELFDLAILWVVFLQFFALLPTLQAVKRAIFFTLSISCKNFYSPEKAFYGSQFKKFREPEKRHRWTWRGSL
jgi:hypothetical protein